MCKKILAVVFVLSLFACTRKPLYLQGDCHISINVTAQASIDDYWDASWRDSLLYDWNEAELGPLGYSTPDNIEVVIFRDGDIYKEEKVKMGQRQLLDIELESMYDILLYNRPWSGELGWEYKGGRYYIYTKPTTKSSLSDKYETVFQPGDILSAYQRNIYLSDDVSDYDEISENGKIVYVYNIDALLRPVSYIYIIQFIIVNDDHSERIEAKDITNFTISGICDKKDLFSGKAKYNGLKQISTFDVQEGQEIADSLVFASRFTILSLLPENEEDSWSTRENYLYYSGIDISTYTFGSISGIIDITSQLNRNPMGGIITVRIKNSDIKKGGSDPEGGSFGIDVDEWERHIIDIPF